MRERKTILECFDTLGAHETIEIIKRNILAAVSSLEHEMNEALKEAIATIQSGSKTQETLALIDARIADIAKNSLFD